MNEISRKGFFAVLGGGLALMLMKPLRVFGAEPAKKKALAVPLSTLPELATPGGGTIVKLKDIPVMLIRVDEKTVVAYKPVCTHDKCAVQYNATDKNIVCPCHQAKFDLTGKPIMGPPTIPLESYKAIIRDDKVLVVM
jgi:Rieske Fe-S protein